MKTKKHTPGRLQISTECNQDCLFCSVPKFPIETPSLYDLKGRIIKLKDQGTNDLFITGGEPTIHKGFFKILDFAEKVGFDEITIQTNGSKLDASFLKKIKKYKNVKFDVSFHSFEKDVFKKLSGSGNYKKFLSGLKNLQKSNIPVFLTIVINKLNYRKLKEHIKFIKKNFSNIRHFSLNFIDPVSISKKDQYIVPTLAETEKYIYDAVRYIIENGMTFRLERVPLCYMDGFEEFSTEVRMPAFNEKRITYFAQNIMDNNRKLNIEKKSRYYKKEDCKCCFLKELCPGLNPNYIEIHGTNEIFPVFTKPKEIITRIKDSKNKLVKKKVKGQLTFKQKVYNDLKLFKKAIEIKPNKNNIYDTYSYFAMQGEGINDKEFIYKAWKIFTDKIKSGEKHNLMSLYIHFPYCQSACDYCVYPSTQLKDRKQIKEYIDYLINDMKLFSQLFKGIKFKTLSIGGGTPSLMSSSQLRNLLNNVFHYFEFEESGERSIEFNPNTTNSDKLGVLDSFCFNKLSIGVQSLSPKVLKVINREYQTLESVKQTVEDFKRTKMGLLNVDMLLGLRGDTTKDFLYSFEEVCKMEPNLICIYPIKTNKNYIKKRYGSDKNFLGFYYSLFNDVKKKIPKIANKYDYSCYKDTSKLSYVHPMDFSLKKQPERDIKYFYSNFRTEPYSTLGLGYYAESCIDENMRYICVDKNNQSTMFLKEFSTDKNNFVYSINKFSPNYARIKFITHSVYENFAIYIDKYKKAFGTDIIDDFPYAIKALQYLKIITVNNKKISFNVNDEKETYEYLLFFVGRDYVMKKTNFKNSL